MSKAKQYNPRSLYFPERITGTMDGIFDYPLTIVEAPMGYGKTTAVREHLNQAGVNLLWLRVYDGSTSSFWNGFAQLFRELDDDRTQSLLCLGFPEDVISAQEALKLIGDIELPGPAILVIDDYHMIDSPAVNSFIELLVENEIDNLHIVLSTRYTTIQKLAELKLKGYLHHISKETLELVPQEIAGYYHACGIKLKSSEADQLYALTEGWISALYLLMLEYIAEGRYTSAKNIYTLMEKAIYDPLSDEIKEFVITMCIFENFTHEQAVHMWGTEDTGMLLDGITNKNAFVNYDDRLKTYHMHKIFTGFLQGELEKKDIRFKQDLNQKAARWHLKNGDYFDAIHYFYECGNFDNILTTLEDGRLTFSYEKEDYLMKYMEECPREVKARHPFGFLKYALYLFSYNELALFGKACEEFSSMIETDSSLNDGLKRRLIGEYELLISFTAYNDLPKMSQHHRKAFELLTGPGVLLNTRSVWTFGSTSVLYLYYRESGRLKEHVRELEEALIYYTPLTNGQGGGADYVMEAERQFFSGDFVNAEILGHKSVYQAQSKMQPGTVICAMFVQIRLALFKGDFSDMLDILQKMRVDIISGRQYMLIHTVDMCEGYIYSLLNQTDKIPQWIATGSISSSRLMFPAFGTFNIVFGRTLLINGEYLKLIGSADYFISIASVFPNLLGQIYTHIYLAAARRQIFAEDDAISNLEQALAIAMPDRVYMPFVENCDYIEPLLIRLAGEGHYREDIARILTLYETYRQSKEQIIREYFTEEKPWLTDREIEIARLAAEGYTNAEIGKQLYISANTVKMALKSIYAKLSINSRSLLQQYLNDLDR
ncbi:MAG: helix-turn-helix transcriptional regulator [Firmicutes bacterium HGW-Firmicutes-15]|nr:MAG: helix-turn-helix transcriptional regulator [Firmicutes bacterium HGW-Firmicutes-15]